MGSSEGIMRSGTAAAVGVTPMSLGRFPENSSVPSDLLDRDALPKIYRRSLVVRGNGFLAGLRTICQKLSPPLIPRRGEDQSGQPFNQETLRYTPL